MVSVTDSHQMVPGSSPAPDEDFFHIKMMLMKHFFSVSLICLDLDYSLYFSYDSGCRGRAEYKRSITISAE